ncbi:hypothetical protein [Pseudoxanthomonas kaohsiungensis]|jgi:hypothetical protein|uniref:Uncharacterized protein n=1 Tax=Pseudoxanthomonas kaohsiungensis TaxID=283923 RepID=A0ABW3LWW9_9GAMM|nr:hypothetical protein [Pseudoxanthomonas kaohsiungensis]KAF1705070.1 hypothetical protein CSC66_00585 [Pseudoxanthomonas kaohsiungensis]
MNDATPDALHDDLVDLRDALEREDFRCAGDVLALHDRRMRQYIDTVGMQAPLLALRELLTLQHRLQAPALSVHATGTLQ